MLRWGNFGGLYPKLDRYFARPPNSAEDVALDCSVRTGSLRPLSVPRRVGAVAEGQRGFLALEETQFIGLERPANQVRLHNMVLGVDGFSGIFYARRNSAEPDIFLLGVPRPTEDLTVVVSDAGTSNDMTTTLFAYTFVDGNGHEGQAGGLVSVTARLDAEFRVTLPAITHGEDGNYPQPATGYQYDTDNLKRRLYRSQGTQLNFIEEVEGNAAASVNYSLDNEPAGGAVGVRQALSTDALPPERPAHIALMPGGFLAATDGNRVRFSRVNEFAVWPEEFAYDFQVPVIDIEVDVDVLYVALEGSEIRIMNAPAPDAAQIYHSEIPWICISGQSMVNTGYGVFYASHSGIVALQNTQGSLITKQHFDDESFQRYEPELIRSFSIDGQYYTYGNARPFLLDTQAVSANFELSELSYRPSDVKTLNGLPYGLADNLIYRHEPQNRKRFYTWQSSPAKFPRSFIPRALQIRADFDQDEIPSGTSGGIGRHAIGRSRIGAAGGQAFANTQSEATVIIRIMDQHGFELARVECNDELPYPCIARSKSDTFAICVDANIPVHSVSIASTQRDLQSQVT